MKKCGCNRWREMTRLSRLAALAVFLISLTGIATQVAASPLTLLDTPSEIVRLQANDITAEAVFRVVDGRFELKMTFTETGGNSLSTRVLLVDSQRFSVAFEHEDDEIAATSFAFRRNGQAIEMTASPIPATRKVAAR